MKRFAIFTGVCLSLALSIGNLPTCAQSGELRTIPLVVMTSAGKIVANVAPQNLKIKGPRATVQRVTLDTSSRHVVMLMDVSGSMAGPAGFSLHTTRWDYAKELANAFLADTSKQDLVALDAFGVKEMQIVPFTHDFASISKAIDRLPKPDSKAAKAQYKAYTAAGDALDSVLRQDGSSLGFGDAVIFFSDGEFGDAGRNIDSMVGELERRNVRVFLALALHIGPDWPSQDPDFNVETVSDSFSFMGETGGFSFAPAIFPSTQLLPVSGPGSKNWHIVALCNAIHATYRLQLQLEAPFHKKQKLQLEIVDNQGKKVRNVFLYYPRNLYPDSPSNP